MTLVFVVAAALSPVRGMAETSDGLVTLSGAEVIEAEHLYQRRPVIVFADTPDDPSYQRQVSQLARYTADLAVRDVLLVLDTDPGNPSALRQRLRPRGFSLVLMDKDWKPSIRKPLPWDGREILSSIDKMPLARSEALERHPSGR